MTATKTVDKVLSEQELKDLGTRMEEMKMQQLAAVKKA